MLFILILILVYILILRSKKYSITVFYDFDVYSCILYILLLSSFFITYYLLIEVFILKKSDSINCLFGLILIILSFINVSTIIYLLLDTNKFLIESGNFALILNSAIKIIIFGAFFIYGNYIFSVNLIEKKILGTIIIFISLMLFLIDMISLYFYKERIITP